MSYFVRTRDVACLQQIKSESIVFRKQEKIHKKVDMQWKRYIWCFSLSIYCLHSLSRNGLSVKLDLQERGEKDEISQIIQELGWKQVSYIKLSTTCMEEFGKGTVFVKVQLLRSGAAF